MDRHWRLTGLTALIIETAPSTINRFFRADMAVYVLFVWIKACAEG